MAKAQEKPGQQAGRAASAVPLPLSAEHRLLTRREVAVELERTLTAVKGLERIGRLQSVVGQDRIRRYPLAHVLELKRTLPRRPQAAIAQEAEQAAQVFTLLDGGVHPVEIVKQLRAHPDAVELLQSQWARMRGESVLNAKDRATLNALVLEGPEITDTASLIEAFATSLQAAGNRKRCGRCKIEPARICDGCAKNVDKVRSDG